MSSDEFDPTPYLRPPIVDVPSGIALGVALLHATPKIATDSVRKAATKLRMATVGLQEAWSRTGRAASAGERRLADIAIDNAWSALHARLDAYAALPPSYWPKAERAAELVAALFPDGLAFLTFVYDEEWAEGEERLRKIEAQGLARDIDAVAGPEFLAEVRRAQRCYGEVLDIGKGSERNPAAEVTEPLRTLSRAITGYALQIIASSDGSAAAIRMVRQALKPIDDLRPAASSRRGAALASDFAAAPEAKAPNP